MVEYDFAEAHAAEAEIREGPEGILKAASLLHGEGKTWEAVRLLTRADNIDVPACISLAKDYFCVVFWQNMSFGVRRWSNAFDVPIEEARAITVKLKSVLLATEKRNNLVSRRGSISPRDEP